VLRGHFAEPVSDVSLRDIAERYVGEVGEEPLAAVGLEVFERSVGEVGAFLGQPGAPEAGEGHLGPGGR
jgi:hypothetical protein